jgi:hypothetical protein
MKKLLIGLLFLGSFASFADEKRDFDIIVKKFAATFVDYESNEGQKLMKNSPVREIMEDYLFELESNERFQAIVKKAKDNNMLITLEINKKYDVGIPIAIFREKKFISSSTVYFKWRKIDETLDELDSDLNYSIKNL